MGRMKMAYDALFGKADRYIEQKTALDSEFELFEEEEKKAADAGDFMESSDSELREAFLNIEHEFDYERRNLEEQKGQTEQTREGLSAEAGRELQKLKEVQRKLDHLSGKKYAESTERASEKCREYMDQMEEMLRTLGEDVSLGNGGRADDKRAEETDTDLCPHIKDQEEALPSLDRASAFSAHEQKLGAKFVRSMQEVLDQSRHEDVRNIYEIYGSRLTIAKAHHLGGAYYQHGKGVCINTAAIALGGLAQKPYQAAFHEFGHNIDYLMGDGEPISEKWGNGALYEALQQDFADLKGELTDWKLVLKMNAEAVKNRWSLKETLALSDMIESFTGISNPLGSGHGKNYWKNRLPCREFFAEVLDGATANEGSYALLKQMFPRGVEVVHRIIGGEAG